MKKVIGIVKAHKIIFLAIAIVLVGGIATGVTFAILNAQPEQSTEKASQDDSKAQLNEDKDESTVADEDAEAESTVDSGQDGSPIEPLSIPSAGPSEADLQEQIKADCIATASNYYRRYNSGFQQEYVNLNDEQKASYDPNGYGRDIALSNYRQSIMDEFNNWKISSGCSQYGV